MFNFQCKDIEKKWEFQVNVKPLTILNTGRFFT